MFGIEKRVDRVRHALVQALKAKAVQIMSLHSDKKPELIPKNDLARSQVLLDLAEILTTLKVDKHPDDDKVDKE